MSAIIANEMMYVNAYVKQFYPQATALGKTRVGARPMADTASVVLLGYPDKILILPGLIILIEAKIKPEIAAVGQLEFYGTQFLLTPGFEVYKDYKIELQLVVPLEDPNVRAFAESKGMKYVIYKPKEINNLLEDRLSK